MDDNEEEDDDYRTEETQGNDTGSLAKKTAILSKKSGIP